MDRALLVGIDAYPYPNELRGCINDVDDIEAELVNAFGFRPGNIVKLQDADATADKIKSALHDSVSKLQDEDRFLFWYSGHGAQLEEGNPLTDVICPVDFNFTLSTSVTVDDFYNAFSKIPTRVEAVWGSDTCQSGDLEKDLYRMGIPRRFRRDPAKRRFAAKRSTFSGFRVISAEFPNIALISGCRSDQTGADACINGRYNGAFTYYFLQSLRAPSGLQTPLNDLLAEVHAALRNAGYDQIPQLSGPPSCVDCPLLQPI